MRVLVVLFCWKAYFVNPDGTTSMASAWNEQNCRDIAAYDAVAGDPSYCWQDKKNYTPKDRGLCRRQPQ